MESPQKVNCPCPCHAVRNRKAVDAVESLHNPVRNLKAVDAVESLHDRVRVLTSRNQVYPISIYFFEDPRLMIVQCNKKALNKEVIDSIVNMAAEESYRIRYYNTQ